MMTDTILGKARQPTNNSGAKSPNTKNPLEKRKVLARFEQLYTHRQPFVDRWKAIRDYQLPYLGCFDDTNDSTNQHRRMDNKVMTGTAWEADQVFSAGVMSGLTPPSRQWFKFNFDNPALADNVQAASVLDERNDIMYAILAKANFYNAVHSCYAELPFGQAPMAIFPNPETIVHFIPFSCGSYVMDVGANGVVDVFGRKYQMTVAQMLDQFGEENLPHSVQSILKSGDRYSTRFTVCFLAEPNTDYKEGSPLQSDMPYRVMYWVDGSAENEWLHIGGCHEFPIKVARYLVNGLEPYAKGAGWFAEGDAKMLQALEREYLTSVQLVNKPPMVSDADTAAKGINLVPGASNAVANTQSRLEPLLNVRPDLTALKDKIETTKSAVKRAYSSDLFLLLGEIDRGQMTAREVMERTQEKLQQLGPVVERLQFEFLNPILERIYAIAERANVFPPFPDEILDQLQGEEIKIEYLSPLVQAQKMSGLTAIEQSLAFTGQVAQLYPEALDSKNWDEVINKYDDMLGIPAVCTRSKDDVVAIRKQRAEAQRKQEQLQQMANAAPAANQATQAAKNLSEAVGGGSEAVASLFGMGGSQ